MVATPIGNLQDITIRAAKTLLEVPFIIAESTSKAGTLLEFLKKEFPQFKYSQKQIVSFTEDEEDLKLPSIFKKIGADDAALISEAGTPLISDPGFKFVREAIKRNVRTIPIPGPSALLAALTVSGLPTDRFTFVGFLPKSASSQKRILTELEKIQTTIVLFESPHRIKKTVQNISDIFGDIQIVLTRELTKLHEEIIRDSARNILKKMDHAKPKGEFVILLSAKSF